MEGRRVNTLKLIVLVSIPILVFSWIMQPISQLLFSPQPCLSTLPPIITHSNITIDSLQSKTKSFSVFATDEIKLAADATISRKLTGGARTSVVKILLNNLSQLKKKISLYQVKWKRGITQVWSRTKMLWKRKAHPTSPLESPQNKPCDETTPVTPSQKAYQIDIDDHFEMDIDLLPLTEDQKKRIFGIYHRLYAHYLNDSMLSLAEETHSPITPHTVYRYLAAEEWNELYMGKSFEESIVNTIAWRHTYGIHLVPPMEVLRKFLPTGFCYVAPSHVKDTHRRPLLFLKLGALKHSHKQVTLSDYLDIFLYSLERAKKQSLRNGVGTFTTIVDFHDFSWHICPPMSFVHSIFDILKQHYPYRVGKIYMVNTGTVFSLLWRLVHPFVPKKVLQRVEMISSKQDLAMKFAAEFGLENVESGYHPLGQLAPVLPQTPAEIEEYIMDGYWTERRR